MVKVILKGDVVQEYESGLTAYDIAGRISKGLQKAACAVKVDGEVADLRTVIDKDCALEILTFDDPDGRHAFWHTTAHIMAEAVQRLYSDVKLATGPAIDGGFFYDFDTPRAFTPEDLEAIEAEMKKIVAADEPIERFYLPEDEALKLMEEKGETYKLELIREHAAAGDELSFYTQGGFTDLCAGPHLMSTGPVKALKLTQTTGAYWRGDSDNPMLTRLYGTAFPKAADLQKHLDRIEEAKKRDHRKLGRELDLFSLLDEGPGFPFFHPKGMILRNELEDYWRKLHVKAGYSEIKTPIILSEELWHRSGHWDHYRDNMYTTKIDGDDYAVKPMNCPGGMLMYKRRIWSYRDLPLRMGELGLVHRHELSGALQGLMRVRCFTQDDAHIFMTKEQIKDEVIGVIDLTTQVYQLFGFPFHVELSTRPDNSMGSDADWELATNALKEALDAKGMEYVINEGDGAFYGPKIDFHLEDCLGRTWQCGTIQLDFQMPERFDLTYVGADNEKHRPVMVHRVIYGSIERFIAILTEHFAGAFPMWLSPEQVRVLPISDKQVEVCRDMTDKLLEAGIRASLDERSEKIGFKIREAQLQKVNYMLVVGDREAGEGKVSVRSRKEGDIGVLPLGEFIDMARQEIDSKKFDLA